MAQRRGHGEGSIFKRNDGLWAAEIYLGRGPDNKRRRKTVYGHTRKEVAGKLQAIMVQLQEGRTIDTTKLTVAEYLERWLQEAAAPTIRATTLESYTRYIRLHAIPVIGHVQLSQLHPLHLQELYTAKLDSGLSRRTVQYLHAILRRALKQAVRWQLIPSNPTDAVDAPRPARQPAHVLSLEQMRQLADALTGDSLEAFYYLAMATGARRGELVALRWSDVDLDRGEMHINRTAQQLGRQVVWSEPKTEKSRRRIPLPAEAISMLKQHRKHQAEERLMAGGFAQDQGLVFCRNDGSPVQPDHVSHHFAIILRHAGLPPVRLHDLRHTHATMLLAAGVNPKIVSERLGHSTITLTMDTYSHVLPTMQDEVARTLNQLLPPHSQGTH